LGGAKTYAIRGITRRCKQCGKKKKKKKKKKKNPTVAKSGKTATYQRCSGNGKAVGTKKDTKKACGYQWLGP